MADTTAFDRIRALTARAREFSAADDYAMAMAVGVGADDPDPDKSMLTVMVYQRRLYSLSVGPGYVDSEQIPIENTALMVNGVIQLAWQSWESEFLRLRELAHQVLEEEGPASGVEMLREVAAESNPLSGTGLDDEDD